MLIHRNLSRKLHCEGGPAIKTDKLEQYWQEDKLHRSDGPAVISKLGTKLYYWRGMYIPPALWEKRHTMPVSEVLNYPNLEMRRTLIEIRGWERFLEEANAEVLHHDKEREAWLYRVVLPKTGETEDEPVIVVRVTDSTPLPDGSRRNYFIRVPPRTESNSMFKTCLEAIAWTFNMNKEKYVLEVET